MELNLDDLLGSGGYSLMGGGLDTALPAPTFSLGDFSPKIDAGLGLEGLSTGVGDTGVGRFSSTLDTSTPSAGGWRGVVGDIGNAAKTVLPLAQIGTGIMGAVGNIQAAGQLADQAKIQRQGMQSQLASAQQAREMAGNVSAPAGTLVNFGQGQLARAEAGQIDPAMQSIIDRWKQGAKQQMLQRLASSGQATSSTAAQLDQILEQMAVGMQGELLQSMKAQGVGATQAGGGLLASGAGASAGAGAAAAGANQQALQQSQVLQSLIGSANQALARMGAGASVT